MDEKRLRSTRALARAEPSRQFEALRRLGLCLLCATAVLGLARLGQGLSGPGLTGPGVTRNAAEAAGPATLAAGPAR